ncbi:hypothetical protein [Hymenobacter sp. CRA2]|uniref:hypothetical protein n=1 Tax=Hymenobacter sp. CRA2 TaxID=1955620 RepID=UPI001115CA22|nr:hypothetical protein [Hymenobacter sp. CRA2]
MLRVSKFQAYRAVLEELLSGSTINAYGHARALQSQLNTAYHSFIEEVEGNLLKLSEARQKLHLEDLIAGLREYSSFMPRDNRDIEDSIIKVLMQPREVNVSAEALEDARVYHMRILLSNDIPESISFESADWRVYQTVLAAASIEKAWERLNALYARRGGVPSAVPQQLEEMGPVQVRVIRDLRMYAPGFGELPSEHLPTESHGLEEWAQELSRLTWRNYPYSRPWLAPLDYEQAFDNAPNKKAFLAGLLRLLDAVDPLLAMADVESWLFRRHNSALSADMRSELRQQMLHHARTGSRHMRQWVDMRLSTASLQLLDALERILLVPDWDGAGRPTSRVTIAGEHTQNEVDARFQMLVARFKNELPKTSIELNSVRHRLECIINWSTNKVVELLDYERNNYSLTRLRSLLPSFKIVEHEGVKIQTTSTLADNFCDKLVHTMLARIPWASQALAYINQVVEDGRDILPRKVSSSQGQKLSLKQIALVSIYKGISITKGRVANNIANEYGYKSGEKLYKNYIALVKPIDRLNISDQQLSNMIENIQAVIPLLQGNQLGRAQDELRTLQVKKGTDRDRSLA